MGTHGRNHGNGEEWAGIDNQYIKKHKLNTKILTEVELIGAYDMMPQMLWARYLLESHGYGINKNILYQDNMSAIMLENNSK